MVQTMKRNEYGTELYVKYGFNESEEWFVDGIDGNKVSNKAKKDIDQILRQIEVKNGYEVVFKTKKKSNKNVSKKVKQIKHAKDWADQSQHLLDSLDDGQALQSDQDETYGKRTGSYTTGTFAYKMGLQGVLMDYVHPSTISHIPLKYETIANHLQGIGYDTRLYGKWHVGYSKAAYTPTQRGFNHHIGYYQYAIDPFTKNNLDAWSQGKDWFIDGQFNDNAQYASDILLEHILDDLDAYEEETDDPLFMYIALSNPHFPVETPEAFNTQNMYKCADIENEDRRKYCVSVQYLDLAVGQVIDTLKSNGMYENSVIGMLSDNGPQVLDLCGNPGQHVAAGSAYPLRGGKYTLFQGGVQTLAFISGGMVPTQSKGMQSNLMMSAVDWLPTWLHFTDFYEDRSLDIDGIDVFDEIFADATAPSSMRMSKGRKYIILSMEYEHDKYINTAIIHNNHKLLINNKLDFFDGKSCNVRSANPFSEDAGFASTIIDDGRNVPDLMLFDLANDPNEYNDLLNGEGTANPIIQGNEDHSIKSLVVYMIKILDFERRHKVSEMRTQSFESFEDINPGIPIPLDTHLMDGVHRPFQSEDEDEFPS
eukprot:289622_1